MNTLKTIGLEEVYYKLDKQILLAEKYTEIKELSFIIKSCRLKPLLYTKKRTSNITLYYDWIDEFGYSINLTNKKFNILNNNLDYIACTDMYYGLNIFNTIKISKLAYIQYGKCEMLSSDIIIISLLGIDNYFRTFIYDDEWSKASTLILGFEVLKQISNNLDIDVATDTIPAAIQLSESQQLLTSLPFNDEVNNKLKFNQILKNII